MARTTRTPEEEDELIQLRAREARLRARIEELESERTSPPSVASLASEVNTRTRDNLGRAVDEASLLARGVTLASLEAIRTTTEAVDSFVSGVYQRNQPSADTSISGLVRQLPSDIVREFFHGVTHVLDVPGRAINTLSKTYNEGQAQRQGVSAAPAPDSTAAAGDPS